MKKQTKYNLIWGSIILIVSLIALIYNPILKPSYFSYAEVCLNTNIEDYGYYTTGKTTYNETDKTTVITIVNNLPYEVFSKTLKHETIHKNQFSRLIPLNCGNLYFKEIEAYTFSNLPNDIFCKLYSC